MIPLKSPLYEIKAVLYKTKAEVFEGMRAGDVIYFTTTLKHRGSNSRGGAYATDVRVFNITQNSWVTKSQSEMANIISKLFVLDEITDVEAFKEAYNKRMWEEAFGKEESNEEN